MTSTVSLGRCNSGIGLNLAVILHETGGFEATKCLHQNADPRLIEAARSRNPARRPIQTDPWPWACDA